MPGKPRISESAHYAFVFSFLPFLAMRSGSRWLLFANENMLDDIRQYVAGYWDEFTSRLSEPPGFTLDDIRLHAFPDLKRPLLIFEMPEPPRSPLAHYVAVAPGPDFNPDAFPMLDFEQVPRIVRLFTLEKMHFRPKRIRRRDIRKAILRKHAAAAGAAPGDESGLDGRVGAGDDDSEPGSVLCEALSRGHINHGVRLNPSIENFRKAIAEALEKEQMRHKPMDEEDL